jgi:dUTP pyrophosphatase
LTKQPVVVQPGDRVAQMVIAPVIQGAVEEVADLSSSQRGEGGFGHTG